MFFSSLWIMTSYKGPFCDGQKIDKQKYFPLERCLYNLKQSCQSQSAPMVLPGMGHLSKPTNLSHRTRHTIWQVGHSCHMPRCLGICVRQSKPWEVIYVCLKRGNLELFVFNAIDSNEDVNRKLSLLLIQSSSILTNKSLTMCPPLKLKSLPMTDHSCQHIF